jgi:hypothetical protein
MRWVAISEVIEYAVQPLFSCLLSYKKELLGEQVCMKRHQSAATVRFANLMDHGQQFVLGNLPKN